MAYKDFAPAQILTAQEVDTYLMRQTVMSFATSTARDAAITTPVEGMVAYLADSNTFWYYDGSAWTNLGNVMRYASYAARANALPSPVEGMVSYLQDVDELEVYNGSSWLRVVVTSDDEGFSTTGTIRAVSGGADGGLIMEPYPADAGYVQLATNNMVTDEYLLLSDGTSTWLSCGSGGAVRIRPSANSTTGQWEISTGGSIVNGNITNQGTIISSSSVTAVNGGADGGIALRTWTANSSYMSVSTRDMVGQEYMLLSNGTDTFVSAGSGGASHIRSGANGSGTQLYVGPSYAEFAGRVRFPGQPAVYAHNSNSYSLTDNQTLRFDVVSINRGSHYNGGNSEFTAPIDGLYYVHCQVLTQYNGSPSDMRIAVNNVRVDAYSGYSLVNGALSSHKQGHVQGIVSVTAGQYISIKSVGSIDFYGSPAAGHSSLLIHFLG